MRAPSSEVEAQERVDRLSRMPRSLAVFKRIDALLDSLTEHSDPRLKDLKRWEETMAITISMEHEITEREACMWDEQLTIMEKVGRVREGER